MDNKEGAITALTESVDKLKGAVESRVDAVESSVKTLVEKDTDYQNDLSNLKETIAGWKDSGVPTDEGTIKKAMAEILDKQEKLHIQERQVLPAGQSKYVVPDTWKSTGSLADYLIDGVDDYSVKGLLGKGRDGFQKLVNLPPMDQNHKNLLHVATDVKIAETMGRLTNKHYKGFNAHFPKLSQFWNRTLKSYAESYGLDTKGMDLTDTANWVPEGWTSELREIIQLQLAVAGLFERLPMPQNPYNLPIDITDTLGDLIGETTGVTNPWDDTDLQAFDDQKTQFDAKKLRARMLTSAELTEDAIVSLLSLIRQKLVKILVGSLESAIISGDSNATHGDNDVETGSATDPRRAWLGLRHYCFDNSFEDDHSAAIVSLAGLNTVRKGMGEYGVDPADMAYLMPPGVFIDAMNISEVKTLEVFGSAATILTGQLAAINGIPVVVSRYYPVNLAATGVNTVGGPNTLTSVLLVNRQSYMIGDLRNITLESERLINTDQTNVVAFQRLDFKNIFDTAGSTPATVRQLINVLP